MGPVTKTADSPTLDEIATRINAHLKRFERDPVINASLPARGGRPYYNASAFRQSPRSPRILVIYVSYQGNTPMLREQALAYLAWLDAGNVGTHDDAERATEKADDHG